MPGPIFRFSAACLLALSLLTAVAWAQNPGAAGRPAPTRRPFAKPGTPRQAERIRYVDVKHIKAELTLTTKKKEVRGTVTHTLSPLHPYPQPASSSTAGPKLKVTQGDRRPQGKAPCTFTRQGRQAVGHPRQGLRARRHARPGDRVLRLARARAPLRPARPGLSREAALDLDPGRGRGHAPLAPLLRLPQRPRHQRDDHHGREAAVRRSPTGSWSRPSRTPATPRPITGRWTCPTSAT